MTSDLLALAVVRLNREGFASYRCDETFTLGLPLGPLCKVRG